MSDMILLLIVFVLLMLKLTNGDSNVFGHCLRDSRNPSLKECVGRQAISFLQTFEDSENFTFSPGVVASKDENAALRSVPNFLEQDPVDFRGILENAGAIFGQRSLQWDLGNLYPGLCLRIGPTADINSALEFVMDPSREVVEDEFYFAGEHSTARILTRKFLLPFLLGLKFNLATIIPLIFGAVILLCKKAAFLAKFALFLSGIFGIGGALSLSSLAGGFGGFGGGGSILNEGYGHIRPITHPIGGFSNAGAIQANGNGFYRTERKVIFDKPREFGEPTQTPDLFYNYEKNVLGQDRNGNIYEKSVEAPIEGAPGQSSYRSFSWKTVP